MRTETDVLLSLQRYVAAALPDFTEILTVLEHERPERPFAVVSADGDSATEGTYAARETTWPFTVQAYVKGDTRKAAREAAEAAREALFQAFELGEVPRHFPLFDYTGKPAVVRITLRNATAGLWAVELDGDTSTFLEPDAQPIDVREAVEGLSGVGAGNVAIIGKARGPWALRFDGELRGKPIGPVTVDTSDLLGPGPAPPSAIIDVLSVGDPAPWRDPREYVRLDQVALGGLPDPADPTFRTVTASLRCTWGRASHVPSAEMTLTGITARPR